MSAVRKQTPPMDLCLSGQVFFISTQVTKLEPLAYNIALLGGKVEVFFSKDVTTLLVDDCCLNEYYFLSRELLYNCFPEEKAHSLPKICPTTAVVPPCTSRGYSFLASARGGQISTSDSSAFRIIERAKQLGINVTGIRQFTTFIEKHLVIPTNSRKRKPAVQKVKLVGCFVKVEDVAQKYKTFYKVLTEDPVRYLPVKPITLVYNRLMNEHRLNIPSPTNVRVNKILIRDNFPEIFAFQDHSKSKVNCVKPNKNISPKITPKSKKRTNHFCECCNVYFSDFSQHIFGEKHRLFANDRRNYDCVDDILKTLPSIQDFLKKHSKVQEPESTLEVIRINEAPIDYTMPKSINILVDENLKTGYCAENFNGLLNPEGNLKLNPEVDLKLNPMAKLQINSPPVSFINITPSTTVTNSVVVNSMCIPNETKEITEKKASLLNDLTPIDTGQNRGDWDGIDFDMDFDCLFDNYNNGDFDKELVEERFREFSEHISKNVLVGENDKDMPVLSVFSPTENVPNSKVLAESKRPSTTTTENTFTTDRLAILPEAKPNRVLNTNNPLNLGAVVKKETNLNNTKVTENLLEFNKTNINFLPSKNDRMFSDDSSEGNNCPNNNLISNVLTMISNSDKRPVERIKLKEDVPPSSTELTNEKNEMMQASSVSVQPVLSNSRKSRKYSPLWSVCTLPSKSIRLRFTCLKQTVEVVESEESDMGSLSPKSIDSPDTSHSAEEAEIS